MFGYPLHHLQWETDCKIVKYVCYKLQHTCVFKLCRKNIYLPYLSLLVSSYTDRFWFYVPRFWDIRFWKSQYNRGELNLVCATPNTERLHLKTSKVVCLSRNDVLCTQDNPQTLKVISMKTVDSNVGEMDFFKNTGAENWNDLHKKTCVQLEWSNT